MELGQLPNPRFPMDWWESCEDAARWCGALSLPLEECDPVGGFYSCGQRPPVTPPATPPIPPPTPQPQPGTPPPFSPVVADIPSHLDCTWAAQICAELGGHMAACDGKEYICMLPAGAVIDPDKPRPQTQKPGYPWGLLAIGTGIGALAIWAIYTDPSR